MTLVLKTGLICYYGINTLRIFVILLFKWYFKVLFHFYDNYAAIYFLVPNFFDLEIVNPVILLGNVEVSSDFYFWEKKKIRLIIVF